MFGTGLLKGLGVTLKHFTDTYTDDLKKVPSRYEDSIELGDGQRIVDQPADMEGLITIQYPEERRILPERFRYIPMLLWDTEKGEDRCTACGICAKVCPPQCIWIVRDSDEAGQTGDAPGGVLHRRDSLHELRLLCGVLPVRRDQDEPRCGAGSISTATRTWCMTKRN